MTDFTPRRSSPRLGSFEYRGGFWYFVTTNTHDRRRPTLTGKWADDCVSSLEQAAVKEQFELHAFCIMPNHVHLLISGGSDRSGLLSFMQRFKQGPGFRYKQATGNPLWHRSFYDHILREEDEPNDFALYIWENPVRAQLCDGISSYRWSGPRKYVDPLDDRAKALSVRSASTLEQMFIESAKISDSVPEAVR